jgi:hypothetical protein
VVQITVFTDGEMRKGVIPKMMSVMRLISRIPCPRIIKGPADAPLFADSATVMLESGPGTSAPERAIINDEKPITKRFILVMPSVFQFLRNGGCPFSWRSEKQSPVDSSRTPGMGRARFLEGRVHYVLAMVPAFQPSLHHLFGRVITLCDVLSICGPYISKP